MRYLIPALLLASPALAHPDSAPHTHAEILAVAVAVLSIGAAGVLARRRAARAGR